MAESLQRLREPTAIVVLIVTGLQILLALASLANEGGIYTARGYLIQPVTALILGLVVGACALWQRSPHARLITLLALVGLGVQVVLGFIFSLLSLVSAGPTFGVISLLAALGALAIVTMIGWGLLTIYRGLPAPQRPAAQLDYGQSYGQSYGQPPQQAYGQPGYPAQPGYGPGQPSAPPATPPWQPDPQAGQSWRTAGEAASGASAADWGGSGRDQGWQPHLPPASSASAAEAPPKSGTETRITPPAGPTPEVEPPRKPADGPQWWDQK